MKEPNPRLFREGCHYNPKIIAWAVCHGNKLISIKELETAKEIIETKLKITFIECLLQISFYAKDLTWIFI